MQSDFRCPLGFGRVAAGFLASLLAIGCQTAKTSFQIDSDSRSPVFGFELAPRKPAEGVAEIRQSSSERDDTRLVDLERRRARPKRSPWTSLRNRFGKPKRIPLPRTDLESAAVEVPTTPDETAPDETNRVLDAVNEF